MGMLTTCLVSLAGVNIILGAARWWRRSVESRMVRQVRAWPGLDTYHADLLSAAEPLCSTDHQPDALARNASRAAEVAVRLLRRDGLLRGHSLELAETAAEPAHPVTAAAFRAIALHPGATRPRLGDIGRDPGFRSAVRAHLKELFTHAPATRRHLGTTIRGLALRAYALGAAAPAVHAYLLLRRAAPTDPDIVKGSFLLASLVFVAALAVITAQAGNIWHPLQEPEIPLALEEPGPRGDDPAAPGDGDPEAVRRDCT
ncbi:hypothetical protein ABZ434_11090 [Streptomyces sp. NPDC005761]|uniref:hypothetical protein n=1 Tax=Streptomyces sp. NPDC005761 TaxID=3157066 RepID=UPI0033CA64AF